MAKPSPKTEARREKFRKIGQAISAMKIGDPDVPDYHTGRDSRFHMARYDSHDKDLHEIPLGPQFKTPQWQRTVKH